jgi:nucleotide-binding universal stress UspA family protein
MKRRAFLPLVTYPDAVSEAAAANAVATAARLGASLDVLVVDVDIPPVSNALSRLLLDTPQLIRKAEALSHQRGRELLAAVRAEAERTGVAVADSERTAAPALLGEVAAGEARYFDLGLVAWQAGNETAQMVAEAVIFGSGRPTILLPEAVSAVTPEHVAIAWDGSRVAARAVADAEAILQAAAKISVLTVTDEKPLPEADAGEKLAEGLRRKGLPAESVAILAEDCEIGTTLQEHAIARGATLLVMGGYGHSRMRDFVLGGATRGILDDLRLPVLLSH